MDVAMLAAQLAVLLGTAWIVTRVLHGQAAALRHLILLTALCLTVPLPVARLALPTWLSVTSPFPRAADVRVSARVARLEYKTPTVVPPPARDVAAAWPSAQAWMLMGWAAGGMLMLLRLTQRLRTLSALRRSPTFVDEHWADTLAGLRDEVRLTREVTLRLAPHGSPVVSWGWLQPQVLVPASARSWSHARIRSVLCHELAHVARHDWLRFVSLELIRALYWWHPLVWIAVREARLLAEHACDDVVLSHRVPPAAYAEQLVDLARESATCRSSVVTAIASPSSLERRITAMLNPAIDRSPVRALARSLVVVPLVSLTVVLAGTSATASTQTGTLAAVVRPDGGHPLADVEVVLTTAGQPDTRVRTDANGAFTASLPAGTYLAVIRVPGFKRFESRVDVTAGARVDRDFALSLGALTQRIFVAGETDPDATPVELAPGPSALQVGVVGIPRRIDDGKAPAYPAALREAGVEGTVRATGRVGPDGYVTDVAILESPHDGLSGIVTEYLAKMRYEPTRVQGMPVATTLELTMDFRAQR